MFYFLDVSGHLKNEIFDPWSVEIAAVEPVGIVDQLWARLLCPWNFPDKNTGLNCHFFLQGIFRTQGLNLCVLGLLIDRVTEEIWMRVCDIVQQEAVIKTIPKKKKCKKPKWLSEEALKIAEKRREAKGKWKKERYTHLNAEFQRIARRDKKAFLSEKCKETE